MKKPFHLVLKTLGQKRNCSINRVLKTFILIIGLISGSSLSAQQLPINIDFTSDLGGMIIVQDNQTNYWHHGNLSSHSGNCMFITNDGVNNTYDNTFTSVSHIYKLIDFNSIRSATISFDWQSNGEQSFDYLEVYLVPNTLSINAGTLISSQYKLGRYQTTNNVNSESIAIGQTEISQDNMNLVFTWKNDGSAGSNPPASIDNISVIERTPSNSKELISIAYHKQTINETIDLNDNTIQMEVYGSDITSIAPVFEISEFASLSPASGTAQNFTNPVQYTITAEDGTTVNWTVSISNVNDNFQPLPINATFNSGDEGFVGVIAKQENFWVHNHLDAYANNCMFITNNGTDNVYSTSTTTYSHLFKSIDFNGLTSATISFDWRSNGWSYHYLSVSLVPEDYEVIAGTRISSDYTIANYYSSNEVTNTQLDISSDRIVSNRMRLVFSWINGTGGSNQHPASIDNVNVIERTKYVDNDIIAFGHPQATEVIIDETNKTINMTVLNADITSLAPSIEISEFATISPAINTLQDFTSPVQYTVYAENGNQQIWTVTVTPTTLTHQALPIEANFNTDIEGVTFLQYDQANYWMYGNLTSQNSNCLYITNNGTDNQYDNSSPAISHCIKPVDFNGTRLATLSFDWLANGESSWDYLKVYLTPSNTNISAGDYISNEYLLGTFNKATGVEKATIYLNDTHIIQDDMFLTFTWRNDGSSGSNPPVSIDNISLTERLHETDNDIINFETSTSLDNTTIIDANNHTVYLMVLSSDLTAIAPTIDISLMSTISPASGVAQDFTNPVQYTVTSESGVEQIWMVTIENPTFQTLPVNATFEDDEDGFLFMQSTQPNYWMRGNLLSHNSNCLFITNDGTNNTYDDNSSSVSHCIKPINFSGINSSILNFDWLANGESSYDYLQVYLIPEATTITAGNTNSSNYIIGTYNSTNTVENTTINLTNSHITQDNMLLVFSWVNDGSVGGNPPVSIDNIYVGAPRTDNDITEFTLSEQITNATINPTNHTVHIGVTENTDVTSLIPSITVSDGATISPDNGIAQDFSSPVTYTVTAENGNTQDWIITVSSTPTALEDEIFSELSLYPNPVNDLLKVEINLFKSDNIKIEIYDVTGSIIWSTTKRAVSLIEEIPLGNQNKGIYFVRITAGTKVISKKVTKK